MTSSQITIIISFPVSKYLYARLLSSNLDSIKLGFIFLDQWTHLLLLFFCYHLTFLLVVSNTPHSWSYQYVLVTFIRALRHCEEMIQRYSRALNNSSLSLSGAVLPHCSFSNVGKAVEDCMRAVIGVLLNLTHDNGTLIYNLTLVCIRFCLGFILCFFQLSSIYSH